MNPRYQRIFYHIPAALTFSLDIAYVAPLLLNCKLSIYWFESGKLVCGLAQESHSAEMHVTCCATSFPVRTERRKYLLCTD